MACNTTWEIGIAVGSYQSFLGEIALGSSIYRVECLGRTEGSSSSGEVERRVKCDLREQF